MNTVEWTPDLDTGFAEIDEQHKQLVFYINAFYKAFASGEQERMNTVLFDLISCAVDHFDYEEEMMRKAGYPLLEPHRRVHQNFIAKLQDLQGKLFQGDESVTDELISSLDGWLFRHIKINDRGYINCVNEAGVYSNSAEGIMAQAQTYEEPFVLAEEPADGSDKQQAASPAVEPDRPAASVIRSSSSNNRPRSGGIGTLTSEDNDNRPRGGIGTL